MDASFHLDEDVDAEALREAQMDAPDSMVTIVRDEHGHAFGIVLATLVEDEWSPTGWSYDSYGYTIDLDGQPMASTGGGFSGYGMPDAPGLVFDALDLAPESRDGLVCEPSDMATFRAVEACAEANVRVVL